MIKNLEKEEIVKYPCDTFYWNLFGFERGMDARYRDYELAEKVFPYIKGWCNANKRGDRKLVLVEKDNRTFWFSLTKNQTKAFRRESRHIDERIKDGVSFRDAWNVDSWLADKCSKILTLLDKNTYSYPTCVEELHEKVLAIEGKTLEKTEEEKNMSHDDLCIKWYHDDLKRMAFLFAQWDEDKCIEKNQYQHTLRMVSHLITEGPHKGMYTIDFEGSDEEKAEAEKYHQRENEIYKFRQDCLHKAMKIMEIYIEYLWD